jgi:hypothetical protein
MISMLVVSLGLSFTDHHVLTPIVGGKLERKET